MTKTVLTAALSLLAATAGQAQSIPPATRPVEVFDPQYQMLAMRMSIPTGWRFAGTVARPQGCHANGAALKFTALSPDGAMGFAQFPGVQWSSGQQGVRAACPPVGLQSVADFLVNIAAPNLRSGSVVTGLLPATPERAAQLAQLTQQRNAVLNQMGGRSSFRAEGARARIKFNDAGGRPMEGQINAAVNCTEGASYTGGRTRTCTVDAINFAYAPAGRLEALLQSSFYLKLSHEAQVNPQWQQRLANDSSNQFKGMMAGNARNLQQLIASGDAAHQALMQQHSADMTQQQQHYQDLQGQHDAQMAGYAKSNTTEMNRQDAVHGQAQQTVRYAGDRALFQDPNTGRQIEADANYNHQWMSGDGQTLLQTNDHIYDPNGRVGSQEWTELVPR